MISNDLKKYLSEHVPQRATNVLFQLFNGIRSILQHFEYRLDINKRESNILTAQYKSSLRHLASQNGYEPQLKTASTGILFMKITPKLFQRVGYPLYIKPYAVFRNSVTKAEYVYNSDVTIRITDNNVFIPVVEGVIITDSSNVGNGEHIQRVYLPDNIAADSIMVESESHRFKHVKSFVDNVDVNNNKQFEIKFSNNPKKPIILYIKGVKPDAAIIIHYILCNGTYGNIDKRTYFETESLIDKTGSLVTFDDDELTITNASGFSFGSNGSDENDLRAAIGYNHGIEILFDNISYRNFLNRFSTILIQDIRVNRISKQVNNIYLWRRCYPNLSNLVNDYKRIILNKEYIVSHEEKNELDDLITKREYCLSSHTINDVRIRRFAFQIVFDNLTEQLEHQEVLEKMIYENFSKFLYTRNYSFNFERMITEYSEQHHIRLNARIFNDGDQDITSVISHNNGYDEFGKTYVEIDVNTYLPILDGGFDIRVKGNNEKYTIIKPINFASVR